MVLVVLGHGADYGTSQYASFRFTYLFVYIFHMPLFLFISGLFFKDLYIRKKIMYYIAIGFAMKILICFLHILLGYDKLSFNLLGDSEIPWFMFVLAIFTGVTHVTRFINKKFLLLFSVLLACFVGYDKNIGDFLYLSRGIIFYPFYLLGTMISKEDILNFYKTHDRLKIIYGLIVLTISICLFWYFVDQLYFLRPLFTARNSFYHIKVALRWAWALRLFYYFLVVIISLAFMSLISVKQLPYISKWGSRTLSVFFWHNCVLQLLHYYGFFTLLYENKVGRGSLIFLAILITIVLSQNCFGSCLDKIKKAVFTDSKL